MQMTCRVISQKNIQMTDIHSCLISLYTWDMQIKTKMSCYNTPSKVASHFFNIIKDLRGHGVTGTHTLFMGM